MARYRGPRVKLMRAVGLDLPGLSRKTIERRPSPPGSREGKFKRKKSEFGTQLLEKQKLRFNYGVTERYMRRIVREALQSKAHSGHKLLELLERRLDSALFRAGFAPTIAAARQLVGHKHVKVDGKAITIPSYRVSPGQVLSLTVKGAKVPSSITSLEAPTLARPAWISYDPAAQTAKIITVPDRDSFAFPIEIQMVVEYYSRRVG